MRTTSPKDIVYLVKADPQNDSEELRYSLRSLQNIPHRRVVIAGEKPDWAQNVDYIPVPQDLTKAGNVARNLMAAVAHGPLSKEFTLMNDDFFFMKPIADMPVLNFGPMKDVLDHYRHRYPDGSEYIKAMESLYGTLLAQGHKIPISYELHVPMVFDKEKITAMYKQIAGARVYQFRTFYGNYWKLGGETVPDVKIFLDPAHNDPQYNQDPATYLQKQTFLSATGGAFKRGLAGEYVRSVFRTPSPYEA